jgi:hypothetical protein
MTKSQDVVASFAHNTLQRREFGVEVRQEPCGFRSRPQLVNDIGNDEAFR